MSNWKLHTPNGVNDILAEECQAKNELEKKIKGVFASRGYSEVQTPTFEYYDCYTGIGGQLSVDPGGYSPVIALSSIG